MKKDILQTEHSIEKEVQIVTKNKKYSIIEATVELHRENYIVKKQKYGLYKAGLLLEHPILLQGLGPLPCLILSTGVLIDHTCLSQILAIGFIYIFLYKIYKKAHSDRHPDSFFWGVCGLVWCLLGCFVCLFFGWFAVLVGGFGVCLGFLGGFLLRV